MAEITRWKIWGSPLKGYGEGGVKIYVLNNLKANIFQISSIIVLSFSLTTTLSEWTSLNGFTSLNVKLQLDSSVGFIEWLGTVIVFGIDTV